MDNYDSDCNNDAYVPKQHELITTFTVTTPDASESYKLHRIITED